MMFVIQTLYNIELCVSNRYYLYYTNSIIYYSIDSIL